MNEGGALGLWHRVVKSQILLEETDIQIIQQLSHGRQTVFVRNVPFDANADDLKEAQMGFLKCQLCSLHLCPQLKTVGLIK